MNDLKYEYYDLILPFLPALFAYIGELCPEIKTILKPL